MAGVLKVQTEKSPLIGGADFSDFGLGSCFVRKVAFGLFGHQNHPYVFDALDTYVFGGMFIRASMDYY